jgi:hypothetical protein
MSQAASQAWSFYRDVAKTRRLWTIRDEEGYPAPKDAAGQRAQPFWSSASRVQKILKSVPAYRGFDPVEVTWDDFCHEWVPLLSRDGLRVGVNWSGPRATGYDLAPEEVKANVEAEMQRGAT